MRMQRRGRRIICIGVQHVKSYWPRNRHFGSLALRRKKALKSLETAVPKWAQQEAATRTLFQIKAQRKRRCCSSRTSWCSKMSSSRTMAKTISTMTSCLRKRYTTWPRTESDSRKASLSLNKASQLILNHLSSISGKSIDYAGKKYIWSLWR